MLNRKATTLVVVSLMMVVCMFTLFMAKQPALAQTIPTRTPTPSAQQPTATSQPAATATPNNGGGGQDPTPVPPTATTSSGGQTPTPIPPTATTAAGGAVPTATAVSGGEAPAPTATAVSYPGAAAPTATVAPTTSGEGYPAPPSANPVTAAYPEAATSSEADPALGETTVIGSEVVTNELEETAVVPAPEQTNTTPNLLPLVGLVLLAAGVFGLIFWRRQHQEA